LRALAVDLCRLSPARLSRVSSPGSFPSEGAAGKAPRISCQGAISVARGRRYGETLPQPLVGRPSRCYHRHLMSIPGLFAPRTCELSVLKRILDHEVQTGAGRWLAFQGSADPL